MLKLVFDYTHGNILDIGKYHKLMLSISINSLLKWWLQWYGEIYYLRLIAISVASCGALSDNLATLEDLLRCPSIAWEVVDWASADYSLACRSSGCDLGLVPCKLADLWYPDRWYQSVNNWFG